MIPKKIHYCWFGGNELPIKAKKCIASWQQYCPDYELIEWNENNFDIEHNPYTKWCYDNKKFAFLSDYVRLLVVEKYGGLYFDTDVEVVRPFDELLECKAFFGFETSVYVNTGVGFGAEPHNPVVHQMLEEYLRLLDGKHGVIGCPHLNTDALVKFGLQRNGKKQELLEATVFPVDFFNPYDAPTGILKITANTYSIHWYSATWMSTSQRIRSIISRPLHRLLGKSFFSKR